MPDNRYEKLGWRPADEINNWIRRVSGKNRLKISDVLTRMALEYIANHDPAYYETHLAPQARVSNSMTYE